MPLALIRACQLLKHRKTLFLVTKVKREMTINVFYKKVVLLFLSTLRRILAN
jgi:hypothetical protein